MVIFRTGHLYPPLQWKIFSTLRENVSEPWKGIAHAYTFISVVIKFRTNITSSLPNPVVSFRPKSTRDHVFDTFCKKTFHFLPACNAEENICIRIAFPPYYRVAPFPHLATPWPSPAAPKALFIFVFYGTTS